jgi:hypothetical protein
MISFDWSSILQTITVALILGCLGMLKAGYTILVQLKTWSHEHEKLDDVRFESLQPKRSAKKKR